MTTNYFDTSATQWDQKQPRVEMAHAIARAIGELPLDSTITAMEYGCGTGLVGLQLAPRLRSLTAVDTSAGMLEVLNEKIREMNLTNVTSRCLDLTVDAFDEHFDLVFSAMTLHHIEDTELILGKLAEQLNPDGYLAVADLDSEDGSFHSPGAGEKHHGFDRERLIEILRRQGLAEIQCRTAHTVTKTGNDGKTHDYPVFLITARKQ